jgi:site-specific recombinase XerD
MACIYRRKKSPFLYLSFTEGGRRQHVSTGLRADSAIDRRRAEALVAKYTWAEKSVPSSAGSTATGWDWVPAFLTSIARAPRTLEAYELRWRNLSNFLAQQRLAHPRAVSHEHAQAYLLWRTAHRRPAGKNIAHNTATAEVKMLKTILGEAKIRGVVERNPFEAFRARLDTPAEKAEITGEERIRIEDALLTQPLWMRRAWRISMATGCRLRETRIDLRTQVDLARGTLCFDAPKGGRRRAYTIPLPKSLRPMIEELLQKQTRFTLEFPVVPSRDWRVFFDSLGMTHLCFHCCRVTFITALARANVPLAVAMRLVNHASLTIHRIYQRMNLADLREWTDRLDALPPSPVPPAKPRTPRGRSTARASESPRKD